MQAIIEKIDECGFQAKIKEEDSEISKKEKITFFTKRFEDITKNNDLKALIRLLSNMNDALRDEDYLKTITQISDQQLKQVTLTDFVIDLKVHKSDKKLKITQEKGNKGYNDQELLNLISEDISGFYQDMISFIRSLSTIMTSETKEDALDSINILCQFISAGKKAYVLKIKN